MSNETLFKLIIELIVALSHYLWPIATLIVALIFRRPITALLGRVRKGKLFGQELELDPTVIEFRKSVQQVEKEILQLPAKNEPIIESANQAQIEAFTDEAKQTDDEINKILDDSRANPEIAIIRLSAILDRELRELLATTGWMPPRRKVSMSEAIHILDSMGQLPKHAMNSLNIFRELRNEIVHGHAVDQRNVLQVLDTGITLLKAIRAIPHEINIVYDVVDIYEDEQCSKKINDAKGLILETTSPGGGIKSKRIFPTTTGDYYKKGKKVSWEWNQSKSWKQTWYIDPDDEKKKSAWHGSMEFAGKHLDEL